MRRDLQGEKKSYMIVKSVTLRGKNLLPNWRLKKIMIKIARILKVRRARLLVRCPSRRRPVCPSIHPSPMQNTHLYSVIIAVSTKKRASPVAARRAGSGVSVPADGRADSFMRVYADFLQRPSIRSNCRVVSIQEIAVVVAAVAAAAAPPSKY